MRGIELVENLVTAEGSSGDHLLLVVKAVGNGEVLQELLADKFAAGFPAAAATTKRFPYNTGNWKL